MSHASPQPSRLPAGVYCAQDYEALAAHCLPAPVLAWIAGGSGQELSLRANRRAFEALAIVPRMLRDLRGGHTRLRLLGRERRHPLLLAPLAWQTLVHPRGELDTARGAAAAETCMVASTLSSFTLEEIAAAGAGDRWFQLYAQPRRADTLDLLRRAEAAGFQAIVLTVDASVQTPGLRARRAGFELPAHLHAANLRAYPPPAPRVLAREESPIFQGVMAEAPGWDDLGWLLDNTRLPVLVKGVLHADDACRLKAMGVAGIVVSNHGGRALDGAPAALSMLPAIRAAVGEDYPLLLDGGVRSGSDVFKALALGADAVLIGRLQVYALAVAGALGVAHLLKLLREELELCMAQAGCATLRDLDADCLMPAAPAFSFSHGVPTC